MKLIKPKVNDFVDALLFTQFADKVTIILKVRLWLTNSEFENELKQIQDLRDDLPHANNYAATSDAAINLCNTVRIIEKWNEKRYQLPTDWRIKAKRRRAIDEMDVVPDVRNPARGYRGLHRGDLQRFESVGRAEPDSVSAACALLWRPRHPPARSVKTLGPEGLASVRWIRGDSQQDSNSVAICEGHGACQFS